ncbi:MAG: 3-oxoacyl-ACP synthase III [Desulfobulbus sp.]|jgi:3-oxoacyl-[acyl-carrier-protein] synthase-3|uniref:3-oxoacyl-ACP synthase III n=1 Tax=Desulfobulbus sp. TaxID=895 RepID=UPI00284C1043|nr:3-oxoacyl-ACP synthase III [Desulfobulbus sp.]MDR2550642.1 3-oxoacyl-ACP synthase III [Desulfobulbus sp.]
MNLRFDRVCLHAFGHALPPVELSSAAIEERLGPLYERLKLPAGRLELMTGIGSRRLWPPGTRPSDGAAAAGAAAIAHSGIDPRALECLLFTSVSRDMMEPATAAFVHRTLKLPPSCLLFDISNACLGFLDGMVMLANMLELGQVRAGLLVAGETAEDLIASTLQHLLADTTLTRKTIKPLFASLTIGSGAVALVMTRSDYLDTGHYLRGGACRANTAHNDLCQGGQNAEQGTLMSTDSEQLLGKGIETAAACWTAFRENLGWELNAIDRFFCHQVGKAHAQMLFETLRLDPAKNFETLPTLGNVGSVSAPITMALGIEQGALVPGQRAAILGIGSGINALMLGIDW